MILRYRKECRVQAGSVCEQMCPKRVSARLGNEWSSKPCVGGRRLAGYPTCLAATVQLQAAGLLEGERAAAAHSAPGDAFERVYGNVRARVEAADPVLANWNQTRAPACVGVASAMVLVQHGGL